MVGHAELSGHLLLDPFIFTPVFEFAPELENVRAPYNLS
jgi:hypothetical protein